MSPSSTAQAPHKPFSEFVGKWTGVTNIYSRDGSFQREQLTASEINISWVEERPDYMAFEQIISPFEFSSNESQRIHNLSMKEIGKWSAEEFKKLVPNPIIVKFDLKVTENVAEGSGGGYSIRGIQSMPGIYIFMITTPNNTIQTNNQYFLNPNQRNIIGPEITSGGQMLWMVVQTFSRVSF